MQVSFLSCQNESKIVFFGGGEGPNGLCFAKMFLTALDTGLRTFIMTLFLFLLLPVFLYIESNLDR